MNITLSAQKGDNTVSTIQRMLENAQGLIDFDNRVYEDAFGYKAVATVQKQSELMPDTNNPDFAINAMLNIAYDQGFQDCISMITRVIENTRGV